MLKPIEGRSVLAQNQRISMLKASGLKVAEKIKAKSALLKAKGSWGMCFSMTQGGKRVSGLGYVKEHAASVGLLLAAYGAVYLTSALFSSWTLQNWVVAQNYMPASSSIIPHNVMNSAFFLTGFPALIVGTAILCGYTLTGIGAEKSGGKQPIAVILMVFGLGYQLIGAWPFFATVEFPWEWQKQIASYGVAFSGFLYALSVAVFLVGAVSLVLHSRLYHINHPSLEG
jgi:hypothetical protein